MVLFDVVVVIIFDSLDASPVRAKKIKEKKERAQRA